jgi:hypothetical protein
MTCQWRTSAPQTLAEQLSELKATCAQCKESIKELPFLQCTECVSVRFHVSCYHGNKPPTDPHFQHYLVLCRTEGELSKFRLYMAARPGNSLLTDFTGPWRPLPTNQGTAAVTQSATQNPVMNLWMASSTPTWDQPLFKFSETDTTNK